MVISLRPPRRKITCGNWNNTDIHIDWKCMKQPMWEVPAFWLTKNSIYNVWTSTPIFVDWWKILYLSISSGSKCRQTLRRSDTEESLQTGSDRLTPWPLDPLTHPHHPIPIIGAAAPWQKFGGRNFVNKEDVLLTILFQGFCSVRRQWAVPLMNGISKCVGNKSGTYGMLKSVWQSSIWIHLAHLREYVALFWSSIFGTAILGVSWAHASHWLPLWSPSQALMSFALWAQSPEVTISHISKPYLPINSQCVYIHVYVNTYIYIYAHIDSSFISAIFISIFFNPNECRNSRRSPWSWWAASGGISQHHGLTNVVEGLKKREHSSWIFLVYRWW